MIPDPPSSGGYRRSSHASLSTKVVSHRPLRPQAAQAHNTTTVLRPESGSDQSRVPNRYECSGPWLWAPAGIWVAARTPVSGRLQRCKWTRYKWRGDRGRPSLGRSAWWCGGSACEAASCTSRNGTPASRAVMKIGPSGRSPIVRSTALAVRGAKGTVTRWFASRGRWVGSGGCGGCVR